jgi:NAD(P) transhydrogenase subunit alpha
MTIGVLKEPGFETRVSLLAETIAPLIKKGIQVLVETDAGIKCWCANADYEKAGAKITSAADILSQADIILRIQSPDSSQIAASTSSGRSPIFIGVYQPLYNTELVKEFKAKNCTVFSLDMLPRTTRAQSMDVLSSQANIAGYKAVILASDSYPRYFPMFMTAAGSIAPAKVLILGAGVAGLQAIATARRLGAVVEVFDTRPAVKEEVMSLGAKFIEVEGAADASKAGGYAVEQTEEYKQKQQERIGEAITKADIVITTAQIPGKKAPILIKNEMLDKMRNGSLVIDLAAATGGNTEVTKNNETVQYKGVSIIGNSNLPASMPYDASKLYGKNVLNFLQLINDKDGKLNLNWDDDLVKGSCIAHAGEVMHERVKSVVN